MQILKMPQIDPDFYRRYTAVVAQAVEILGRAEVTKQFEKFCDLPFEQSRIAIDACHDSARGAMNTVMEALCEAMQDKIIWLEIMNTPTTTKCAWNNEKLMTFKMFQDFIKKKKALRGCAHDDCKATSKEIDDYNNEMDEVMPHKEGNCEDTNDPWHGQRCNVKWLEKLIEMYCKSCKRIVKDSTYTILLVYQPLWCHCWHAGAQLLDHRSVLLPSFNCTPTGSQISQAPIVSQAPNVCSSTEPEQQHRTRAAAQISQARNGSRAGDSPIVWRYELYAHAGVHLPSALISTLEHLSLLQ